MWQWVSYVWSLDNRYRKWATKKSMEAMLWYKQAEARQRWKDVDPTKLTNAFNNAVDNAPLDAFETNESTKDWINKTLGVDTSKTKWGDTSKNSSNSKAWGNDTKEPEAPTQTSWNSDSSWSPKTSTVSNNKTKTTNTNNAPVKQQPQQYQPEDYEAWRQRKMANWTSYNEVFENAVDKFIADPNSFTQEQKNALIEMWNKLWYDLWTTTTSTATPEYHPQPQNNSYYSNQWDYNFRFSL